MEYYPHYMVPYEGLNPECDVCDLLQISDFVLARRVDYNFKDAKLGTVGPYYTLSADSPVISEFYKRIPFMSMTMMGVAAGVKDAAYIQSAPGSDTWTDGLVKAEDYIGKVKVSSNCFQIIYIASNLHLQPVMYVKKYGSLKEAKEESNLMVDEQKNKVIQNRFQRTDLFDFKGQLLLKHSPSHLNYWHFELVLKYANGKDVKNLTPDFLNSDKEPVGKDSFAVFVFNHYLRKNLIIDKIPFETSLSLSDFYIKGYDADKIQENAESTQQSFCKTAIVEKQELT